MKPGLIGGIVIGRLVFAKVLGSYAVGSLAELSLPRLRGRIAGCGNRDCSLEYRVVPGLGPQLLIIFLCATVIGVLAMLIEFSTATFLFFTVCAVGCIMIAIVNLTIGKKIAADGETALRVWLEQVKASLGEQPQC